MKKGAGLHCLRKNNSNCLTARLNDTDKDIATLKCKDYYNEEIYKIRTRPTSYTKWEEQYYYANFEWQDIAKIPYDCARETLLQSLQFQIINRYFPCNEKLHLWGKREDSACVLCGMVDTLEHYFIECSAIKIFWNSFKLWWRANFNFAINFGALDILLGIPNPNQLNEIRVLNFCILLAKAYVKKCKNKQQSIFFYEYQIELKERIVVEEYIYKLNNCEEKFNNDWECLVQSL